MHIDKVVHVNIFTYCKLQYFLPSDQRSNIGLIVWVSVKLNPIVRPKQTIKFIELIYSRSVNGIWSELNILLVLLFTTLR